MGLVRQTVLANLFGAGLAITYAGIEKIVVDALEGNDRFFIVSTPANAILEIQGGRGSDTSSGGGGNDGEPVVVVSKSLDGHSALVEHTEHTPFGSLSRRDPATGPLGHSVAEHL